MGFIGGPLAAALTPSTFCPLRLTKLDWNDSGDV
jgi:hypothetical protein